MLGVREGAGIRGCGGASGRTGIKRWKRQVSVVRGGKREETGHMGIEAEKGGVGQSPGEKMGAREALGTRG